MTAFGELMRRLMAEQGLSLHRLAKIINYDVGYLSKVRNGKKPPSRQIATRLDTALKADGALAALAPEPVGRGPRARRDTADAEPPRAAAFLPGLPLTKVPSFRDLVSVDRYEAKEDEDPVQRRAFVGLAGATLVGATLAAGAGARLPLSAEEQFAAALTAYPVLAGEAEDARKVDVAALASAVAAAKRDYQGCRYAHVTQNLPALLAELHGAQQALERDARLQVLALSAKAHHVAASVLLKLDSKGLAWLAAERSLQAARQSGDPLLVASSARIVTHVLISSGHLNVATSVARRFAKQVSSEAGQVTPSSLSVYGSLLLRGAIASAMQPNRSVAADLLNEAGDAAQRLGGNHNHHWTAFGPANVLLHRVHVAVLLGDAGTAINYARQVDLSAIPVMERKASLLVDISRAFAQWGKHERAYYALRAADHVAREEITARPAAHRLIRDLIATAPRGIRREIETFAYHIGIPH